MKPKFIDIFNQYRFLLYFIFGSLSSVVASGYLYIDYRFTKIEEEQKLAKEERKSLKQGGNVLSNALIENSFDNYLIRKNMTYSQNKYFLKMCEADTIFVFTRQSIYACDYYLKNRHDVEISEKINKNGEF